MSLPTLSHESEVTLESALEIMRVLMPLLVRSGIGYSEFSAALRPLFYNEAIYELERINQKKTDSSISLLAGLSRREVSELRQVNNGRHELIEVDNVTLPISVPARVIGLWISLDLPHKILIYGEENSFEWLVKKISTEKHPKSILLELKRIGLIEINDKTVTLLKDCFSPSAKLSEAKQIFIDNVCSHLSAGIHNLVENDDKYLEQAIFADEITLDSINRLKYLSLELWEDMSKKILKEAIECCQEDEGKEQAKFNFRLGVYDYSGIMSNK